MDFDRDGPVTLSRDETPDPKALGTCRIESRIAAGRGSRVFRAVDMTLGRTVVVKMMLPREEDLGAPAKFIAAGESLRGLAAANVVDVLRTGQDGDIPYIVFEHVDGEDLDRATRRERQLVPAAAARVILDAAAGLNQGLARGLMHGDVRPRHLIRVRGETKVTGFALSPPYLTAQGRKLRGHPGYIAPEVAGGGGGDHRADIYSLGATLFELVTGRAPFGTGGADALVACHVHESFPTFAGQSVRVPPELDQFLEQMVAKQPSKRFATYLDLINAGTAILPSLRRLIASEPALVVEDGRQTGLRVDIPQGDLLLGRVPGEGMNIDDARCSRRHAMVRRSGDYMEIEDLSSRNGIRVNGADVRSKQLFPGDRVEIGDTMLRVEGATSPLMQQPVVPASPVRGAFGDVEVVHAPQKQAAADALSTESGPGADLRLKLLARLAPCLAAHPGADVQSDVLKALGDVVGADDRVFIRIAGGQPLFEATSSHEAQVLSCILPAIERALPGQLSLATAVKVGTDDRWAVLLAPVMRRNVVTALVALVKVHGRFDEHSLGLLESCCALLSLRADAPRE